MQTKDILFTDQEGREVLPVREKLANEVKYDRSELAFGAVKRNVDALLSQVLPHVLDQVQIGQVRW